MAREGDGEVEEVKENEKKDKEKEKKARRRGVVGLMSWIWNGMFGGRGGRWDDFEKRLEHISKEEAALLSRMKRRSHTWRRMARHLILFSVFFEIIAICYAIISTRSLDLDWKTRAFRVLPMFLLPAFSFATYSALISLARMRDRKDQKALERLRAERQAKIDELKERTNYYTTQQLIQRYDPDPAAKAAAATVLASKLGADSGLKLFVGDDSQSVVSTGKSNDVEVVPSNGLRNRKEGLGKSGGEGSRAMQPVDGETPMPGAEFNQLVVDHFSPDGPGSQSSSWVARIAALLVGEDPTQSYALICGNCHMHNGLSRKEDFPFITYYCPHCHALNRQKQSGESDSVPVAQDTGSLRVGSQADDNSILTDSSDITNAALGSQSETDHAGDKVE
ncbi:hypothetical protein MLD38_024969 [Melastoma candidum]|uniref:Uncharacterized protein n=1 Tax=Melastoma candidum TaxID=119954 RepID=A0ACB9P0R9_9MYRT|nr:hypothetical protein MLD38_024969 [Melastoma candidum]